MHVLVVEPDRALAALLHKGLVGLNYDVVVAYDAHMAIDCLERQAFDVIVLELHLRQHSGFACIYELRSYPEWQEIPIILHTLVPADTLSLSDEQRRVLGIVSYAYKPETSIKQLAKQIGMVSS